MQIIRFVLVISCLVLWTPVQAQNTSVPHPKEVFGFTPGDDYKLANYTQIVSYLRQLAQASDRVHIREIGKSVLGRPLLLLTISSEANLRELDRWREISEQMARARIDDEQAQRLSREGKAVVWIDGGLHATEVAHGQMTSLLAYRVATEESQEMQRIRDNTIMLLMPVMNPDGLDIVASWYEQNRGTPYETTRPPVLYHHYIGHDNNRDWFMNNMPESKPVTNVLYNEWYPQIVYNHHQTGPSWTRIFLPPFSDPVNPNIHPGVTTGVNLVGSAMANRLAIKKMPGAVSGVIYSMWWNGGMRTVPYFHNMIGILTETSHATPVPRTYDPEDMPKMVGGSRRGGGHPTNGTNIFYPYPWQGGESRFKDPVAYMITGSMAVLRLATDLKEQWLYNIYKMGRDAIESGEKGSPFAYVVPPDQWNPREAVELINILRLGGVEVEQVSKPFKAGETTYDEGTYVISTAQAFRPYVVDLLDKQEYPERRSTPNGPPEPPYDIAGWTLPMQMGVTVDRIETSFEYDGVSVSDAAEPRPGHAGDPDYGYILSHQSNAGMHAVNRLLQAGDRVYITDTPLNDMNREFAPGSFIIENRKGAKERIQDLAANLGISFDDLSRKPDGDLRRLKSPRVALYKSWVANMDEGWTRWLLETYDFAPDTLHDADIVHGALKDFDVIILPHQSPDRMLNGHAQGTMPDAYIGGLGLDGAVALKRFVEGGGRIVALDAASDFVIEQFGLPVKNAVAGISSEQFFIPGALLRMTVDPTHPLAYGMPEEAVASFVRSRVFEVLRLPEKREGGVEDLPEAPLPTFDVVARYAKEDILMSGWALGEKKHLGGKAAMIQLPYGEGDIVLFGFKPQFRGQPRGTYKLLFNALLDAAAE